MAGFKKGMSLIEMLAVIAIVFVIIGIGGYTWINGQQKARDARRKNDLTEVQKAIEFYFQDNSRYPLGNGTITCNMGADSSVISWGNEFSCDIDRTGPIQKTVYMKQLPQDPTDEASYYYDSGGGSSYTLGAKLENTRDPEYCEATCVASGKLACEPPIGMSYCVNNP